MALKMKQKNAIKRKTDIVKRCGEVDKIEITVKMINLEIARDGKEKTFRLSGAISHEMIAVAEKLNGVKDAGIRAKYPTIFDDLHVLTGAIV